MARTRTGSVTHQSYKSHTAARNTTSIVSVQSTVSLTKHCTGRTSSFCESGWDGWRGEWREDGEGGGGDRGCKGGIGRSVHPHLLQRSTVPHAHEAIAMALPCHLQPTHTAPQHSAASIQGAVKWCERRGRMCRKGKRTPSHPHPHPHPPPHTRRTVHRGGAAAWWWWCQKWASRTVRGGTHASLPPPFIHSANTATLRKCKRGNAVAPQREVSP
jgi:hypothetical protein